MYRYFTEAMKKEIDRLLHEIFAEARQYEQQQQQQQQQPQQEPLDEFFDEMYASCATT